MVKPAEQTPLTALVLAELVKEAGIPAGVVNVVPGFGSAAGSSLTHHPDVAMISFTGAVGVRGFEAGIFFSILYRDLFVNIIRSKKYVAKHFRTLLLSVIYKYLMSV